MNIFSTTNFAGMNAFALSFISMIAFGMVASPAVIFVVNGWKSRRNDIVGSFDDEAIQLYFDKFHPQSPEEPPANKGVQTQSSEEPPADKGVPTQSPERAKLSKYYDDQFGRWRYIPPMVLLFLLSITFLVWGVITVLSWHKLPEDSSNVPLNVAVFGIAGAFMYVVTSLITHWWSSDLRSSDLYWHCFRLLIAVPMSYAIASAVASNLAIATAFLLGVFPTETVLTIARRLASKNLGIDNLPSNGASELIQLQGIDINCAERLAAEGITTVLQLAYADPIKLTIRTGYGFSFIVDVISQALLWLYMGADYAKLQENGIRGSFEVVGTLGDLDSSDPIRQDGAQKNIIAICTKCKLDEAGFKNVLRQVAADPYSQFLLRVWS